MGIEHRLDKIIRKLQRPLTENEINVRLETTQMVVGQLREDPEWKNWITGAIIFGSTARHTAKTGSDVDLAIKTKQDFFFGLNFSFVTYKLRESIEKIQNELKLNSFKINPQIIAEKWLNDPKSSIYKLDVIESIKKEGINIF